VTISHIFDRDMNSQGIEKRLQQLAGDDLKDPDAQEEKSRLLVRSQHSYYCKAACV
jgi:hypothetical protein